MIIKAAKFAADAHKGQVRKYSGVPYIVHPARVAAMVTLHNIANKDTVSAAWLHDVCEDCEVLPAQIRDLFGETVKHYVTMLTNPSKTMLGVKRRDRKLADLKHLIGCEPTVQIIKLCDIKDNICELVSDLEKGLDIPKSFGRLYANEKQQTIEAIGKVDDVLSQSIAVNIQRLRNLCEWDHK